MRSWATVADAQTTFGDQSVVIENVHMVLGKAAAASSGGLSPLWTSVLWTAGAAIIAALVAALLARSLKISEFRQAWINSLRDDSAELIGLLGDAHEAGTRASGEFAATGGEIWKTEFAPAVAKARTLQSRIRLRINPKPNKNSEADGRFLAALNHLVDGCIDRSSLCSDFQTRMESFEAEARSLLKREWQITKRGLG